MYNPNLTKREWEALVADMTARLDRGDDYTDDQVTIADLVFFEVVETGFRPRCSICGAGALTLGFVVMQGVPFGYRICVGGKVHKWHEATASRIPQ